MKVLITGASSGIGLACVKRFLEAGDEVYALDLKENPLQDKNLHSYIADVRKEESLPEIKGIELLFANAGVQEEEEAIETNLEGTINTVEKYAFQPSIRSVLLNASSSAHTGFEFPRYSASKAGVLGYMKNVAWRLAELYKATCNSVSFGGVLTPLNEPVMDQEEFQKIMDVTPLKKWATPEEAAEWVYFLLKVNRSCTGQDILIDNGEKDLNCTFVWPGFSEK